MRRREIWGKGKRGEGVERLSTTTDFTRHLHASASIREAIRDKGKATRSTNERRIYTNPYYCLSNLAVEDTLLLFIFHR